LHLWTLTETAPLPVSFFLFFLLPHETLQGAHYYQCFTSANELANVVFFDRPLGILGAIKMMQAFDKVSKTHVFLLV